MGLWQLCAFRDHPAYQSLSPSWLYWACGLVWDNPLLLAVKLLHPKPRGPGSPSCFQLSRIQRMSPNYLAQEGPNQYPLFHFLFQGISVHEFLGFEPKLVESVGLGWVKKRLKRCKIGCLQLQSCPVWNGSQKKKRNFWFILGTHLVRWQSSKLISQSSFTGDY